MLAFVKYMHEGSAGAACGSGERVAHAAGGGACGAHVLRALVPPRDGRRRITRHRSEEVVMDRSQSRRLRATAASLLCVGLGACTSTPQGMASMSPVAQSAQAGMNVRSDANILALLHTSNIGEITAGMLAQQRATDTAVKAFGATVAGAARGRAASGAGARDPVADRRRRDAPGRRHRHERHARRNDHQHERRECHGASAGQHALEGAVTVGVRPLRRVELGLLRPRGQTPAVSDPSV